MRDSSAVSDSESVSAAPQSAIVRVGKGVFSFPVMQSALLILLAVLTVRSSFVNPDMWWHLKLGETMWTTRSIPATDLFSFTTNHQAAVPAEWLSEVSIYAAYRLGGNAGLMAWLCVLTTLSLIAGYKLCSLHAGDFKSGFMSAVLIWYFGMIGYAIRPGMIGYLLLIAEMIVIHLGRNRSARWFFWLPAMFVLWVNCHASFMLGLVVLGIVLFSSFFCFQAGSLVALRWDSSCRRMLMLATIGSVAAVFVNPGGMRQVLYPFDTMLNMHVNLASVTEWAPLKMSDEHGIALLLVVLCFFLFTTIRRSEMYWDELLLMGLGTWVAVNHLRMAPIFGVLAAPVLARQFSPFMDQYSAKKDRIWLNAAFVVASIAGAILFFPGKQSLQKQIDADSPVRAVEFIKSNRLTGPMLNDYDFGGYLIWAAPENPVFIDGRADLYEWSGVLAEYMKWVKVESDPNSLPDKYKINFCLLENQSPLVHILPLLPNWKLVYSDKISTIFVRTKGR